MVGVGPQGIDVDAQWRKRRIVQVDPDAVGKLFDINSSDTKRFLYGFDFLVQMISARNGTKR